jgi:hypothetical protein
VWIVVGLAGIVGGGAMAFAAEYKSGAEWPEPKLVAAGEPGAPPSDAIVLFDGKDMSEWEGGEKWIVKDGYVIDNEVSIKTKRTFGDCQLHLEWAAPAEVSGTGQGRGNSGLFLMNTYEIQILDSCENETYFDGQAGSIYKQHPPMVNACRKPGEWQTYDIIFTAPRFKDGKLEKPAYITLLHNGVLVQNHFELTGDTPYNRAPHYEAHADRMPIGLQWHHNPVRFRNIWIREIPAMEPTSVGAPYFVPPPEKKADKPSQPKTDKKPKTDKPKGQKSDQKPAGDKK